MVCWMQVVSPTRELALQTFNFFKTYSKFTDLTGCLLAGGEALDPQFAALATYPDVIIATPGRSSSSPFFITLKTRVE